MNREKEHTLSESTIDDGREGFLGDATPEAIQLLVDEYNEANGADVRESLDRYKRYEQEARQLSEPSASFSQMAHLLNAVEFIEIPGPEMGPGIEPVTKRTARPIHHADDPTYLGDNMSLIPVYGSVRYVQCVDPDCTNPERFARTESGIYGALPTDIQVGRHFHPTQPIWVCKADRVRVWSSSRRWWELTGRGSPARPSPFWLWEPESVVGPFHDLDEVQQVVLTWREELRNDWFADGHGNPSIGNQEIPMDPDVVLLLSMRQSGEIDTLGHNGFDADPES